MISKRIAAAQRSESLARKGSVTTKLAVFTARARFRFVFSAMHKVYHCGISGKSVFSPLCGDAPRPGPEGPGLRRDLGH
jgi:hypothetical protein